ncbi:hypothetical protein ABK040_012887 [Willaertia magna]
MSRRPVASNTGTNKKEERKNKRLMEQKRKEEEERLRREEEERIKREEEEERKRKEEAERIRREKELKRQAEEKARIGAEKFEYLRTLEPKIKKKCRECAEQLAQEEDWKRFVECNNLPKINDRVDMNNFISYWIDNDNIDKDSDYRNLNDDFIHIKEGVETIKQLEYAYLEAKVSGDEEKKEYFKHYIDKISECITETIDDATAHIMQYFDKYLSKDNDQFVKQDQTMKYGIWTNISKNLIRYVEYQPIKISVELAIKGMGFQEIAVRAVQIDHDIFSYTSFKPQNLVVLGGIILIDILYIPPMVHVTDEWKIRQVTDLAYRVKRKPYTQVVDNQEVDGPPAKVQITLPSDLIIRNEKPSVAWWNEKEKCWSKDGISGSKFENEEKVISFLTTHLTCPLAIVYENTFDTDFGRWFVTPLYQAGKGFSVLYIEPKKQEDSLAEIDEIYILIHNGKCKLLSPTRKEIAHIVNCWLGPVELLREMAKSGINLIFEGIETKSEEKDMKLEELERNAYEGLSLISSMCTITNSKLNSHPSIGKDLALARISKNLTDPLTVKDMKDKDEIDLAFIKNNINCSFEETDKWDLMVFHPDKCSFLKPTEPTISEESNGTEIIPLQIPEGLQTHLNAFIALQDKYQDYSKVQKMLEASNMLTLDSVKKLLLLIRPLSF